MKKVTYLGPMKVGEVYTSDGVVKGKRGEEVEVTDSQFDILVGMKDWKGVWEKKKVRDSD